MLHPSNLLHLWISKDVVNSSVKAEVQRLRHRDSILSQRQNEEQTQDCQQQLHHVLLYCYTEMQTGAKEIAEEQGGRKSE